MTDSREIELKFTCGPDDLSAVLAAAPPGDDDTAELISVYFDTVDLALQRAGASLRVREAEGRRVQTVKRGKGVAREEHENTIEGLTPDPGLGPLPDLVPRGARLKPAFNVRVIRRQRQLLFDGAQIELALDQGEVVRGRTSQPICEVELELKSGPPEALFSLARQLCGVAPLYLSYDSKAARGQALATGPAEAARRSEPIQLSGEETVAEAFQAITRAALSQIAANAAILRARPSPEAVHQLRVAARRFRSALSTFGWAVGDRQLPTVKAELKWLGKSCDMARNLDVFAESLIRPTAEAPTAGAAALRKAVGVARRKARAAVVETASSERFCRLMIDLTEWVELGNWLHESPAGQAVRSCAAAALARRRAKVLKAGRDLGRASDESLHHLRIAAKKLRYASDAFAGLYRRKRPSAFLDEVKALQDQLGVLNDTATAGPLVESLPLSPHAALAAGRLLGARTALRTEEVRKAAHALDRLRQSKPFWRR